MILILLILMILILILTSGDVTVSTNLSPLSPLPESKSKLVPRINMTVAIVFVYRMTPLKYTQPRTSQPNKMFL